MGSIPVFFKATVQNTSETETVSNADTTKNNDTTISKRFISIIQLLQPRTSTHKIYNDNDTVVVHYIFETTDLLLRAQSRTAKLKSYGNNAGYDSVTNGAGKLYSLYIIKKTRISDTPERKRFACKISSEEYSN